MIDVIDSLLENIQEGDGETGTRIEVSSCQGVRMPAIQRYPKLSCDAVRFTMFSAGEFDFNRARLPWKGMTFERCR